MTHEKHREDVSVCKYSSASNRQLIVENCERHCRYHKTGNRYKLSKMVPPGICPEAFHHVYPYCLALLYNANLHGQDRLAVECPKPNGGVTFYVSRIKKRSYLRRGEQLLRRLISLFYPVEVLDYDIVVSPNEINGQCEKNMQVGDEYVFNIYNDKELCPAAFDSIFPFIFPSSFISDHDVQSKILGSSGCPDHKANIVFQLYNNDKRLGIGVDKLETIFPGCLPYNEIQLQIVNDTSGNMDNEIAEKLYNLKDCLPDGLCYSLFHNIYPYYLTLLNKGYFGWMRDRRTVVAQCPNPEIHVAVEIRKMGTEKIKLSVVDQKQACPKKLNTGNEFVLRQGDTGFSLRMLRDIAPYINAVNFGIINTILCCGKDGDKTVNVVISKNNRHDEV